MNFSRLRKYKQLLPGLLQFLDISPDAPITVNQAGVIVMVNMTC